MAKTRLRAKDSVAENKTSFDILTSISAFFVAVEHESFTFLRDAAIFSLRVMTKVRADQ
jgi:hypothetical protein